MGLLTTQQELNELVRLGMADAKTMPNGDLNYRITTQGLEYCAEKGWITEEEKNRIMKRRKK